MPRANDPDPALTAATGGPAFPQHVEGGSFGADTQYHGMTLRDWLAGKALTGWLASFPNDAFHPAQEQSIHSCASVAKWSYDMADAMLKHRSGKVY